MDPKQLRERYSSLIAEAKRLGESFNGRESEMTAEDATRIDSLLGQADEVKLQIDRANRLSAADSYLNEPIGTPATFHGFRDAGKDEGNVAVDEQAWRSYKAMTPHGEREYRYFVPLATEAKGYPSAFEAYLRKGRDRMGPNDRKTLSEGIDSAGGFLAPPDYQAELIRKIATLARIRQLARVITTSRDMVRFPKVNHTADDKYTSGVRLTWTGEQPSSGTSHRVTDPVFGELNIPIHTAMASMPISNDLIEDAAFDVLGDSSTLLSEAFALGEDDVFLNGDGIARPLGILAQVDGDGPASVKSGTSAAISTSGDSHSGKRIIDLYYKVPAQYRQRGTWVANSNTLAEIENLVDGQKRPIIKELTQASIGIGEPSTIKGKPVVVDEFMPEVAANSYPIAFGDFSSYLVVDRVGLSIQRLSERYAEENLTLLLARKRVGGYLVQPWRIKVMKASA